MFENIDKGKLEISIDFFGDGLYGAAGLIEIAFNSVFKAALFLYINL